MSSIYKELDVITVVCIISITTSYHIILFVVYIYIHTEYCTLSGVFYDRHLLAAGAGSRQLQRRQQWMSSATMEEIS